MLSSEGSGEAGNVAQAIRFAVNQGARIIHLSIAASVSDQGVRAALQFAVSRNVLVVAACGNDGNNTGPNRRPMRWTAKTHWDATAFLSAP